MWETSLIAEGNCHLRAVLFSYVSVECVLIEDMSCLHMPWWMAILMSLRARQYLCMCPSVSVPGVEPGFSFLHSLLSSVLRIPHFFKMAVDYHMPGDTEIIMIIPEKDRAIVIRITKNQALKTALQNNERSLAGKGQVCNHTCCEIHKNCDIQLVSMAKLVSNRDLDARNSTPMLGCQELHTHGPSRTLRPGSATVTTIQPGFLGS